MCLISKDKYCFSGLNDLRLAEIEVSQRYALPQHSWKTLCPSWSNLIFLKDTHEMITHYLWLDSYSRGLPRWHPGSGWHTPCQDSIFLWSKEEMKTPWRSNPSTSWQLPCRNSRRCDSSFHSRRLNGLPDVSRTRLLYSCCRVVGFSDFCRLKCNFFQISRI